MRFVSLLLACTIGLGLGACRECAEPASAPTPVTAKPAVKPAGRVQVRVDPRVELVAIVERLAGAAEYATVESPYLSALDRHFAPYRDHAAVAMARELRRTHGIGFDAPMSFAVHLDDQRTLVPAAERAALDPRWDRADPDAFAAAVRAFAADTGFDAFFASHADYYATLEAPLRALLEEEQVLAYFDKLFGRTSAAMLVVPSPVAGQRNFGLRAPGTHTQILGVNGLGGRLVVNHLLRTLLVHELAHAYVNPLFDAHRASLEPAARRLYGGVAAAMQAQAYGDPMILLHESGVRAITYNYLREVHGPAAAGVTLRKDLRESFAWTASLAEVVQPGGALLSARIPAIAERLTALATEYEHGVPAPGFLGPVDAVHTQDSIWVVPATPAVDEYARAVHRNLGKSTPVVTSAPAEPLRNLVAYGTPADNPLIADIVKRAGWTLEPGRIAIGSQAFTGEGLVLVACWPRSGAPTFGIAVYAAARAEDVVGINSLRHGETDWLVARRTGSTHEVLGAGDFRHAGPGDWRVPE